MFKPHIVPSPCCHLWFWWYICLIIVTFSLDANFNRQYQREGDQQSSGTFNLFFSDSLYQFYHHENIKKSRQILFKEIWDQISPLNGKQHSWSLDFSSVCLIVYKLLFHLLACSLFHHHYLFQETISTHDAEMLKPRNVSPLFEYKTDSDLLKKSQFYRNHCWIDIVFSIYANCFCESKSMLWEDESQRLGRRLGGEVAAPGVGCIIAERFQMENCREGGRAIIIVIAIVKSRKMGYKPATAVRESLQ